MKKSGKILAIILVTALVLSTMTIFVSADTSTKVFDTDKFYSNEKLADSDNGYIENRVSSSSNYTVYTPATANPALSTDKVTQLKVKEYTSISPIYVPKISDYAEFKQVPLVDARINFYLDNVAYTSTNINQAKSDLNKRSVLVGGARHSGGYHKFTEDGVAAVYFETLTEGEKDLVFTDGTKCEQKKWYTLIADVNKAEKTIDYYVKEAGAADATAKYLYTSVVMTNAWNFESMCLKFFPAATIDYFKSDVAKIYVDMAQLRAYTKNPFGGFSSEIANGFNSLSTSVTNENVSNSFPAGMKPSVQAITSGVEYTLSATTGKSGAENDKSLLIEINSKATWEADGGVSTGNNGMQILWANSQDLSEEITKKYAKVKVDFDIYPITATGSTRAALKLTTYSTEGSTTLSKVAETSASIFTGSYVVPGNAASLKMDDWNHVSVIVDTENSEKILYINDIQCYREDFVSGTEKLHNISGLALRYAGTSNDSMKLDNLDVSVTDLRFDGVVADSAYVAGNSPVTFTAATKFDTNTASGIKVYDEEGNEISGNVTVTNSDIANSATITFTPASAIKPYSNLKLVIPASAKIIRVVDNASVALGTAYEVPFYINDEAGCYIGDLELIKDEESGKAVATVKVRSTTKPAAPIAMFYAASYQENRLQNIDMLSIKPTDTVISTYTAEVPFDSNTTTTKAFLWDSVYAPVYYAEK